MKYTLLTLSLVAGLTVSAQHHDNDFNFSVFSHYNDLPAVSKDAMMLTQEKVQSKFPGWNVNTDKLTGQFKDIYGDAIAIPGNTLGEKVAYCFNNHLKDLGLDKAEWQQTRKTDAPHASYINFAQHIDGHKVVFSDLGFRFTTDGRLVRIKMAAFGKPANSSVVLLDKQRILSNASINEGLSGAIIKSYQIIGDWVWFPVPGTKGYELHPAYEFYITGNSADNFPLELRGYADAATGDILYRTNEVNEVFKLRVMSDSIYKENRTMSVSTEPLANLRMVIDSTRFTGDSGWYENITINPPQSVQLQLQGRWATVRTNGGAIPTLTTTVTINDSTYLFLADSGASIRHVNAYYHTNRVHEFMKTLLPNFTGLDNAITVNVDVPGTCNAFYSNGNTTLNFFPTGGGCNSFAEIGDIVYHEYGHAICYKFYAAQGANFNNGALGEGHADVWGMGITKDSVLGRFRTLGAPTSFIRRYDQAPVVFPMNVNGEVHNDGEIIAGSWWYIAKYTGSYELMSDLFGKTQYDLPNGPNGTEGDVFHDVLISAILNDDDDAILSNGTPNIGVIVKAFADHGIFIMSGATLTHTELAHQPSNTPIPITANLAISETSFFQDMKLFYRVRGTGSNWDSTTLTNTGNFNFTGQLPSFPTMNVIDYYFKVYDFLGNSTYGFPNGYNTVYAGVQVTIPYQFAVGVKTSYKNDFETNTDGWITGAKADNATGGEWIHAKPVGTFYQSLPVQPGFDHTTGSGKCFVTGNSGTQVNSDDVDNGTTTLISPVFDIGPFVFPVVEYYRWFSNDRGSNGRGDAWQVQIRDSTNSIWMNVEFTLQSDYNWRRRVFHVREYLSTSRYIQLRFIAKDAVIATMPNDGQNTVEAALDDFTIYDMAFSDLSVAGSLKNIEISVYPNPANDKLNIVVPVASEGVMFLRDLTGRLITEQKLDGNTDKYTINTSSIAAGQYLLTITTANASEIKKVVISH